MKRADFLRVLAAATLALGIATNSASATSYTFNFSADPSTGNFFNFSSGGLDYQTYAVGLVFDEPLDEPLVFYSGDDITANIKLSLPLTIPSGDQLVSVNLNTDPLDPTDASTIGTFDFSGLFGGVFLNPSYTGCGNCTSNIFVTTGLAFSFTGLVSVATYIFSDGPVTIESLSLSYQVTNPTPVPLPAALPMFVAGVGVLGWAARRRKQKAAALAAA